MNSVKDRALGILSVVGSVYSGLSIMSYSRWDPSFFTYSTVKSPPRNLGGIVGSHMADLMMMLVGFASYSIPLFLLVYGLRRSMGMQRRRSNAAATAIFIASAAVVASLALSTFRFDMEYDPGGLIGHFAAALLEKSVSRLGAYIFALSGLFTSVILLSPIRTVSLMRSPKQEHDEAPPSNILDEGNALIKADHGPAPVDPHSFLDDIGYEAPETAMPEPDEPVFMEPVRTNPVAKKRPERRPAPQESGGYELPPVELLTQYDQSSVRPSREELLQNSSLLESKLKDFGVDGKITHIRSGPVVTLYEFEPAPGVKINRVVSLSDDLALAHKAQSMRVSPVQDKAAIGIEVPNRQREIVSFREIVSSDIFEKGQSKLTLALGKNIFGEPVVADLMRMPHLLVAGATGAGKSVSINSMVMSILYKASPKEVKMLMIDPKLLELSIYEDIPHLISPVITNPKKAAEALRKMVFEMERRYRVLAERGARNIEGYNSRVPDEEKLPFIVIFIDELADLMFASSNEVEDSIARLAQMARAAGMHLIIATQRPSVDVITGLIKANFPARISFQVFSKIDSRTILDSQGAEQLLGKGDMLMMMSGTKLMRVHGALVTENEISEVTEFCKAQGRPDYSIFEEIPAEPPQDETGDDGAEKDEMFDKALEFAEAAGEVSISSLQRRFKIGYNRAARIMEIMAEEGLVGPPKGAGKPRDFIGRR